MSVDPIKPLSQRWPGTQALMLVHGVGDYQPGDYDDLLESLQGVLGAAAWQGIAVYPFFYDAINDWMVQKTQLKSMVTALAATIKSAIPAGVPGVDANLAGAFSEGAADVLWPGFVRDARLAIRDALLDQVTQIVLDGRASNVPRWRQKITILCHSLGCLHTYELLHAAAGNPLYRLQPVTDWVRFSNVVMFASPVQLYRSVGLAPAVRPLIPDSSEMACFAGEIHMPGQLDMAGKFQRSVDQFTAITGAYDPVGGFLLDHKLEWAYMTMPAGTQGFTATVDPQTDLPFANAAQLLAPQLSADLAGMPGPRLPRKNPHSWTRYVEQNPGVIRQCFA